jgi:predicted N-acetyltransferase YhbS
MAAMAINYRKFAPADLDAAHRLSLAVGWPHRREDWQFALALGAGYVAVDAERVVGTILYWKYGKRHAALGMVIVDPASQGRGIGRELMSLALNDLEGSAIRLTATPAGMPLYERLGFEAIGKIEQHQGLAHGGPVVAPARGERLRPIGRSDSRRLAALASRAAGMPRGRVLASLLEVADGIVLDRAGEPIGFALMRRFGRGLAIGPVVAPDAQRAKLLIAHWAAMNPRKFLRIDVHASQGLGAWLGRIGLKKVDTGVTMSKGPPPAKDATLRDFALVNQALG